MKRIIALFVLILSLSVFSVGVNAEMPNVVDYADLISDYEENLLIEKIDSIKNELQFEIVIVTTNDLQGKSKQAYAEDFYDYNGYGVDSRYSGALLLIDMSSRSWYVSTTGYGMDAIDQDGFYYIENDVLPYLANGEYYDGFDRYIDICYELVTFENNGEEVPFEYYEDTYTYYSGSNELSLGKMLLISVVAGFVIALIVVLVMKGKLKTVKAKTTASDYVRAGSLNLTHSSEHFLYRNVTRTKKQNNQSSSHSGGGTHIGSSGRSHGGRGGSF